MERPTVLKGEWIAIGPCLNRILAVVSRVYDLGDSHRDCEVVFDKDKPANCDCVWNGEHWEFVQSASAGGYADKYMRLSEYVSVLRAGKRW